MLAGLQTRLAALLLSGTMVVALFTAKRADITGPLDLVGMTEFLYLVLLAWLATAGAGAISLDERLGQRGGAARRTPTSSR